MSTFSHTSKQLETVTRLSLLHGNTKLFCTECKSLQQVKDVFPNANRTSVLACGHKRDLFLRMPDEIIAFKKEQAKRNGKPVKGTNQKATQTVADYADYEIPHDMPAMRPKPISIEDFVQDGPIEEGAS